MSAPPLSCPVRDCGLALAANVRWAPERTFACPAGHTFDVARRGYVNLLQPQDRKSPEAGDSRESVEARSRLLAAGVGTALVEAVVERALAVLGAPVPTVAPAARTLPVVADLGCGGGEVLTALAARREIIGIGLDLSVPAIECAARTTAAGTGGGAGAPALTWVVANADRRVPLLDASVDLLLSVNARRNPAECARVLAPSGHLLVVVPADDDLLELRAAVMGDEVRRDRTDAVVAEHVARRGEAAQFSLVERRTIRTRPTLEVPQLLDLLRGTYRGARTASAERRNALVPMPVTLASELLLFRSSE